MNKLIKPHGLRALCALAVLLSTLACGTSRGTIGSAPEGAVEQTHGALLERLQERAQSWPPIKATLQGEIVLGGRELSSRINLSAVRGQGIRLSAVPFPLVEAARVWFTPQGVTFVDLINGRYAEEGYEAFSERLGFAIDYHQIEALLLGMVFVPGGQGTSASLASLAYRGERSGGHQLSGSTGGYQYQFDLSATGFLQLFAASTSAGRVFEASYDELSGGDTSSVFPARSNYTLYGRTGSQRGRLSLEWSRVRAVSDTESLGITPSVRSSYERISLDQIMRMLDKL